MASKHPVPRIDGSAVTSGFDVLVESGFVLYDEDQKIIAYQDGELKFDFILTKALLKKPTLSTPQRQLAEEDQKNASPRVKSLRPGSDVDTNGYEIGDSGSDGHFLIANKFCFSRPHLMMLTSDGHRRQHEPLDQSDLEAAWRRLNYLNDATNDFVVFFNCGKDSGCSRLHKHLQLMPLPATGFAIDFLNSSSKEEPQVPFEWFYHKFESGTVTPLCLVETYHRLLQQATAVWKDSVGHDLSDGHACPHNVVFTARWMVVIPRRRAAINKEAGVNSLGMLGIIAVATESEIDNWKRLGMADSLKHLGVAKEMAR
ncbi:ATP adenylyltransferase II [Fusarium heterosporum]|uniref:ATP adenylyltransferase II n=1 Tax=Fusarium heterosporum TaxID=42747 RepID=A0A8H5WKK7_FUSHE|nr:ATP adenylyltransferase II [Fusarium heterosporum]